MLIFLLLLISLLTLVSFSPSFPHSIPSFDSISSLMIVGSISLHSQPPLPLIPAYLLASAVAFFALHLIRAATSLQQAYCFIIQCQIFSNLAGVFLLSAVNIISKDWSDTVIFYLEITADSLFHFASLCYVIVAVHRFIVLGHVYSEKKWTDSVPIVMAFTAIFALGKTSLFRFAYGSMDEDTQGEEGEGMEGTPRINLYNAFYTMMQLGCPLAQIIVILTLDSISFKRLRYFNAQISDRIASNKNVEWKLLSQSLFSCVPNLLFLILLLLIPNLNVYGELTRAFATTGLQMFDVIVDSLVIIVYSKRYSYFRARTSDSIDSESYSNEESQF